MSRWYRIAPHALIALIAMACAATPWTSAAAAGYTYRVLYTFCSLANCADGQSPAATLLMDQAGNLYGTTRGGGGTIFRLTPRTKKKWKFETLHNFCSQSNCASSDTPLIIDMAGNLYGTTRQSSGTDGGLIFELKPNAGGGKWKYKQLYAFPCSDSGCPNGQLPSGLTYLGAASGQPYDGTSALFGTAASGGTGTVAPLGVAFKLEPQNNRWKQTVLYSFCSVAACADGATPNAPIIDSAGRLWGTTSSGGNDRGGGVLFSISGRNESIEYEFCAVTEDCLDGSFPTSPVLLDKSGRLVGTTPLGGTFGAIPKGPGTLFAVSGGNEQVLITSAPKPIARTACTHPPA